MVAYHSSSKPLIRTDLDEKFTSIMAILILGGDLHSKYPKWISKITNIKGRTHQKHSDRYDYQVIGLYELTQFGAIGRAYVLNIFFTKNLQKTYQTFTIT